MTTCEDCGNSEEVKGDVMKNEESQKKVGGHDGERVVVGEPRRRGAVIAWLLAAVVVGGGALGAVKMWPVAAAPVAAAHGGEEGSEKLVNVVMPRVGDSVTTLSLPAGTQALRETTVYARTNGYITKVLVDIGDTVKEGQ